MSQRVRVRRAFEGISKVFNAVSKSYEDALLSKVLAVMPRNYWEFIDSCGLYINDYCCGRKE